MIEAVDRFVRGAGEFADDQRAETATRAVVVRSPQPMRGSRESPACELIKKTGEDIVVYNKDSR